MSRRSARLVSGGYYNSDEESDSSSVTNITYRESPPVRVFKKKAGNRKPVSRTSSRTSSHASSVNIETALTPAKNTGTTSAQQTQQSMGTVPCTSTVATPRPALAPDRGGSQTPAPTLSQGAPPKSSATAGLCGSSKAGANRELNHKHSSSGYSSAEGTYRRATASRKTSTTSAPSSKPAGASGLSRISRRLACMTTNISLSPGMKKALLFLLILTLTALCLWFLLPLLASLRLAWTKTLSPPPPSPVTILETSPPPASVTAPTPAVDPTVVSTAGDEKMQHFLGEVMLKQERLYSKMEERLQRDMQGVRARMEALNSDSRVRLEVELAAIGRQLKDYHTASSTATADLLHRIQAVEAHNSKLVQTLSSIQTRPPSSEPYAKPTPHHQDQLSPELQQAMETWLTDRIKKHDISQLGGKEDCTDCSRPLADKMADFALEPQGASVISTRCSETYRTRSACVTLFGFPLWYPSESPRTVIQGYPVLLPGKCWAFHGVQGTLVISLSHPIRITHVSLDHLPRCNSPTGRINSAPRDFEVYGMINDTEEGSLLGMFTYDQDGESTQTFILPNRSDVIHRFVELRILSNWGHMEYTCVYRFRVHGKIAST